MTLPRGTTAAQQRTDAYAILGVSPNDVAAAPRIKHLIARIKGGWPAALAALRASDLREARAFLARYDDLYIPAYVRRLLPIEAFSVAAGISPTRLFGVITEAIRVQKQQLGVIEAAEYHTDIVRVSSEQALTPEGVEDRMAHLRHMGFMPAPKGAQISIVANASATASADAKSLAVAAPAPEDTIRRIVEARQRQQAALAGSQSATPALPAPTADREVPAFMPSASREAEYVTVDGDYIEMEDDGA